MPPPGDDARGAILTPGALIHNVPDALFFSFVMGLGSFLAWSVAWNSKIRATPDALFVDNIYVVHEIPWRRVRDIVLGSGINVVLDDGEVVGSLHFGGSVIGAITGYPTYRKPVKRLQQAFAKCKEHSTGDSRDRRTYVLFPWRAAVAWYLFFAVPSLVVLAVSGARGGF